MEKPRSSQEKPVVIARPKQGSHVEVRATACFGVVGIGFELVDGSGEVLATATHPRPLVDLARASDVLTLRHSYRLSLMEDGS